MTTRQSSVCSDYDSDCESIKAEGYCLECWLYDPAKGMCPYLRSQTQSDLVTEAEAA